MFALGSACLAADEAARANLQRAAQSLQQAQELQMQGDMRGASSHYRSALELHAPLRSHWQVLTNYGLTIQPEAPEEAVAAFREVISLAPTNADGFFNLGNALSDVDRLEEAVSAFETSVELNPQDADAYYSLGSTRLRLPEEAAHPGLPALQALHHACALGAEDGKHWLSLGDGFAKARRWDEAAPAYRRACALRPTHADSWASAGNCEEELGDQTAAESAWRKSIALDPQGEVAVGSYQNLGALLRRSNRMKESRDAYASALRLKPESAEAYLGLGKCFTAPAGADATLDPASRRAYLVHLSSTYGVAARLQPTNAGAYNAMGEGLLMFGLREPCEELGGKSALDMYKAALDLSPANTCAATHVAYGSRQGVAAPSVLPGSVSGEAAAAEAAEAEALCEGDLLSAAGANGLAATVAHSLDEISADASAPGGAERAAEIWRRNGVVVFPSLLTGEELAGLREHVLAAAANESATDYTAVTRNSRHRVHKALPVGAAAAAIKALAASLAPMLHSALGGGGELSLLESGFMVTSPGAEGQQMHRDVAPAVCSRSSVTVSIQVSLVDTAAEQGALEVIPGSHVYDASVSEQDRMSGKSGLTPLRVAVPQGTVTVYALHTMHRGTANTHTEKRPFFFFTLMGDGHAPPGLAYTIDMEDIGQWRLRGKELVRSES